MKVLNEIGEKSLIVEISKALNKYFILSKVMLTMEDDTFWSQFGTELRHCMQPPRLQTCEKIIETEGLSDLEDDNYNNQIHNYDFAVDYN